MCPKQPSLRAHIQNEDGIALVSSLLITLLLTLVVIALAYRVHLFSIGSRDNVVKSQNIYTTDVGLNSARYFFHDQGCKWVSKDPLATPPIESNQIVCANGLIIKDQLMDVTSQFLVSITGDLTFTVADKEIVIKATDSSLTGANGEGYTYKVYAKASELQDVINVITVAERPGNPAKTAIDVGVKYNKDLDSQNAGTIISQGVIGSRSGFNQNVTIGDDTTTMRTFK